jgi:hypothetical protein
MVKKTDEQHVECGSKRTGGKGDNKPANPENSCGPELNKSCQKSDFSPEPRIGWKEVSLLVSFNSALTVQSMLAIVFRLMRAVVVSKVDGVISIGK